MTRAGFGSEVITPPLPVHLAGFSGRTGPAEDVLDDLEVRAVWLEHDGTAVCLVVCDLLGMSAEFSKPVRQAVAAALDLPVAAVLTSCIHTHAGPNCMAGGERLGWPTPDGYLELLVNRAVAAANAARAESAVAELRFARAGLPEGISVNRRGNPYEPSFAVVDVLDGAGLRLGTVANVAIHPVALGRELLAVSADWVGAYRRSIEGAVDGQAILLSGALGDVNPRPYAHAGLEGSADHAAEVGGEVATAVTALLDGAEPIGDGVRVVRNESIEVPVSGMLAALADPPIEAMPVELVEWEIGRARLVSVPGEAFHALGRAIEASRGDPVLLAGLAPSWQGYLPDPFGEGYEEMVSYGEAAVSGIRGALLPAGRP